jgi:predicted nucleic acid-binding protein
MLMIDTSVWIGVFRDRTGSARAELSTLIGEQEYTLSRFTQMELSC